jgi:hypothetical protein
MKYAVHISDIRAFKSCRRKWSWSSPLKANLEPNIPYAPFFLGRGIHYCLEQYYAQGRVATPITYLDSWAENELKQMEETTGTLWAGESIQFDEQVQLAMAMLSHYTIWQQKDTSIWNDKNLEFLDLPGGQKALEVSFDVPLYSGGRKSTRVYLQGRFDGLVRNTIDNTLWIWETKTTRSIKELGRSLANDEQCGAYIYAAEQLFGEPVSGVLYNILRKKAPAQPEVLKDGFLSKKKSIDTSAEMYIEAIKKHHRGIDERTAMQYYGDIIALLAENDDQKFFARIPVKRTPYEITHLAADLHATALEMVRASTPLYPAPTWVNCNFCSFKNPCLALNAGGDVQFLLDNEYRVRENATSWRAEKEEQ